jgi:hypothetical protein
VDDSATENLLAMTHGPGVGEDFGGDGPTGGSRPSVTVARER